jgi:1,4-dihydroxy-2-naphthoyl-CoA hydrolase
MAGEMATKEGDGLAGLIGLEYLDADPDRARGRVEVTDRVRQPYGAVHGGAYAVIAETVCSRATHFAVAGEGMVALGQANQTTLLRPIADGHVNADAAVRHRGRTTWVWDCEFTDDDGRLCALTRMTVAVRPGDPGRGSR